MASVMKQKSVYTVLPPREHFDLNQAGAVAILVHTLARQSALDPQIIGFACRDELQGVNFKGIHPPWWLRFYSRTTYYLSRISQILKRQDSALIEVHNRVRLCLAIQQRCPQHQYILYIHNVPQSIKGLKTAAEREKVLEKMEHVIVVSEYLKQLFLQGICRYKEKISVLHNALNIHDYPPRFNAKENQLIYVGRMVKEKGALQLARALCEVMPEFPDWQVHFVGARRFGQQTATSNYERAVQDTLKPIQSQVHYHFALPHAQVIPLLLQSKIALVPSVWQEPFGMTAMEAMAAGCAVISSATGGLPEVLGEQGIRVDPHDKTAFAGSIRDLINDDRRLCKIQQCSRAHALEYFNAERQSARLDKLRQTIFQLTSAGKQDV